MAIKIKHFFTLLTSCLLMFGVTVPHAEAEQFQYFYDATNQLTKVIDSSGTVIEYVYDAVGNPVEVRRYTVGALVIFEVVPNQGVAGDRITIRGQGFDPLPANNSVTFNGVATSVTAATVDSLTVTVPATAITGVIHITIAAATVNSATPFMVLPYPVITAISPSITLSGMRLNNFHVTGHNLAGSTFSFAPLFTPPAITVNTMTLDAYGNATVDMTVAGNAVGALTTMASNAAGASSPFPTVSNTLTVLDPYADADLDGLNNAGEFANNTDPFNRDSDGDGFSDGDEVAGVSDPNNRNSLPLNFHAGGVMQLFSVQNQAAPEIGVGKVMGTLFSINNQAAPGIDIGKVTGTLFSIKNNVAPNINKGKASAMPISVQNLGLN